MNSEFSSPFERICLSLSGGGFRSAAFSLGNLSYLQHLPYRAAPLLHQVATLTTASGGTFPGLKYAQDLYEDVPFENTFRTVHAWLKDTNVFDEALSRVRDKHYWKQYPNKRRSLINAAATLYQESLFKGGQMALFYDRPQDTLPHLTSFIGTSTEFKEGLNFRLVWTRVPNDRLTFGTWRWDLHFPNTPYSDPEQGLSTQALAEIQLGDMAAASSAFPGAFEPISFPDDFRPNDSVALQALIDEEGRAAIKALKEERSVLKNADLPRDSAIREKNNEIEQLRDICNPPTALMDGGILDNQGLGAAFHAEEKLGNGKPYHSLFFVADNASYFVNDFEFEPKGKEQGPGARRALRIAQGVTILIALGGVASFWQSTIVGVGLLAAAGLAGMALYFLESKVTRLSRQALNSQNMRGYWKHMVRLPLPLLGRFMKERAKSIFLMVEQVFLKQIRGFYQTKLYRDDTYQYRRLISHLYLFLQPQNPDFSNSEYRRILKNKHTHQLLEAGMLPMDRVFDVVTEAYSMPLTLWFTKEEQDRQLPECLIATGQLTACAMLINHMVELGVPNFENPEPTEGPYQRYSEDEQRELRRTLAKALEDWEKFKSNPKFLVERYLNSGATA